MMTPADEPQFICLNFGDPQECQLCGGWLHAGDPPEVPECEPGIAGRYCSHECHDEAVRNGWCDADRMEPQFVTYALENGEPIWGEYAFTTTLDGFEDRDEEVRLIKRTYRLLSEEVVVLPDPYPIEDEEDA